MLTDEDVLKLAAVFVTKQELQQVKEELEDKMVTKAEWRQTMTVLDGIAGELKEIRQDLLIHR